VLERKVINPKKGDIWELNGNTVEWLKDMQVGDCMTADMMLYNAEMPVEGSFIEQGFLDMLVDDWEINPDVKITHR